MTLLTLLALQASAAEVPEAPPTETIAFDGTSSGRRTSGGDRKKPSGNKGGKAAANKAARKKMKKNYRTGEVVAGVGVVAGTAGLVVLGVGTFGENGLTRTGNMEFGTLNLAAGLLSVGGLVGSSGALGAGIAVDNATRKPAPVISGALGLTLGIFAPTFWGVGWGLEEPGFAWAAVGTGSAATLLTVLQLVQSSNHAPKGWAAHVDPVSRRFVLSGSF